MKNIFRRRGYFDSRLSEVPLLYEAYECPICKRHSEKKWCSWCAKPIEENENQATQGYNLQEKQK